jgi:hypothetical protein
MKPNTNKPKTAKAGRRFRGLEVAQAALLLVLGVVVALTMYFIMVEIIQSTPVPIAQLDAYSSYFFTLNNEHYASVYLKFARSVTVQRLDIVDGDNGIILASLCQWWNVDHWQNFPLSAYAGKEYQFMCKLDPGRTWKPKMYVRLVLSDVTVYYLPWITG